MYVLIDLDRMVFIYAHQNPEVLMSIALIELPHSATGVIWSTVSGFNALTDLELKLLYKHTTGFDHSSYSRYWLRHVVDELASRLPVLQANLYDLQKQCEYICEQDLENWRYHPNSVIPLAQEELFVLPALQTKRDEHFEQRASVLLPLDEEPTLQFAAVGPTGKVARQTAHQQTRVAHSPAPAPRVPVASAVVTGGVRGGGKTRDVIWAKADAMWEAEGKPRQPPVVLALRKRIMDALEVDGVKRTSSSNELGHWQKFRLANI